MNHANDFLARIATYNAEIQLRRVRSRSVSILTLAGESRRANVMPTTGTIFFAVARAGSAKLSALKEIVMRRDYAGYAAFCQSANHYRTLARTARKLIGPIRKALAPARVSKYKRPARTTSQALPEGRSLSHVPSFAELRYGSKTLATGLFVNPTVDISSVTLPYTGGRLRMQDFRLVEYYADDLGPIEGVVVVRPPQLSALEKDILGKLSAAQGEVNLGSTVMFPAAIAEALATALIVEGAKAAAEWVAENHTVDKAVDWAKGIVDDAVDAVTGFAADDAYVADRANDAIFMPAEADNQDYILVAGDQGLQQQDQGQQDQAQQDQGQQDQGQQDQGQQDQGQQDQGQQDQGQQDQGQQDQGQQDQGAGDQQEGGQDHAAEGGLVGRLLGELEVAQVAQVSAELAVRELLAIRTAVLYGRQATNLQRNGVAGGGPALRG
jgi:hypothetical protein